MNQITEANKERIKFLKREVFPDMQYTKAWFNKNIKKIVDTIEARYENIISKSSYFSSLAMIALAVSNDEDKAYLKFSKLSTEYSWKHRDQREEGNLTANEKKNIRTFKNYSIHREIQYNAWVDDPKNLQKMYRALAMSMLTLYVPLRRNDYLDLELVTELPPKPVSDNFILIDHDKNKCYWVLNTPAKTKDSEMALRVGTYPLNSILSARIIESIHAFPRIYLFSDMKDNTNPMTEGSFYKILDGIYKNPKLVVRLDYVRKSYETFVAQQNFSTKFRKKISHYLLHSLETVLTFYSKVNIPEEIENDKYKTTIAYVDSDDVVVIKDDSTPDWKYKYPIIVVEDEDEDGDEVDQEPQAITEHIEPVPVVPAPTTSPDTDIVLDGQSKSPPERHRDAIKKWMADPANKAKHSAKDYLKKINSNIIKNPSKSTLEKHGIVFDGSKYVLS